MFTLEWPSVERPPRPNSPLLYSLIRTYQLRTLHPADHFHQDPCIIPCDDALSHDVKEFQDPFPMMEPVLSGDTSYI